MNTAAKVWPLCPRPQADESLPSWFERVGYEYAMSPALLLGAVEQARAGKEKIEQSLPASRLYEPSVADRLTALANLSDTERDALWSSPSEWELNDRSFCTYCAHCCIADLAEGRTPFGRRVWQQAWCTVCKVHGTALTVRSLAHLPNNRSLLVACRVEEPAGIACAESISGFESAVAAGCTVDHTWLLGGNRENRGSRDRRHCAQSLTVGNIDGSIVFDDPRKTSRRGR